MIHANKPELPSDPARSVTGTCIMPELQYREKELLKQIMAQQ